MYKESPKINKNVKVLLKKKNILPNEIFDSHQLESSTQTKVRIHGGSGILSLCSNLKEVMKNQTCEADEKISQKKFNKKQKKGDVWGNDKEKDEWINAQEKRKKQDLMFNPGEVNSINEENAEEDQIIYIQPSQSEKKLQEMKQKGKKFRDDDFPPNQYSLAGPYDPSGWEKIKWKKILKKLKSPRIFVDKPTPHDIKQGYLGDCYFLAGLAALSEKPDRIYDLFLVRETNDLNYFSVKIIYRGKWRTVDIDDHIPYLYQEPAFSKSRQEELWVVLLEKAWAKIYGSYKQIQGGFAQEPLHDLTGAPIKHIFLKETSSDLEQAWKYLYDGSLKDYAMVASSNSGSDTQQSNSGVVLGHAYTFLDATQIETNRGNERIVKLRNPWGLGQFKGDWSDFHSSWNKVSEEEKQRVGYHPNQKDGIFFMSYDDFTREFNYITVAEINDNASYVYQSCIDPECKGAFFKVEVIKAGLYSFQIDKTPKRSYTGDQKSNFRYPTAEIQIGKLEKNSVTKFRGMITRARTLFKKLELVPGQYIVQAKINYDPNYEQDYEVNLAVYSQFVCGIQLASRQEAIRLTGNKDTQWNGGKDSPSNKNIQLGTSKKIKQKLIQKMNNKKDLLRSQSPKPLRLRATGWQIPLSKVVKSEVIQSKNEKNQTYLESSTTKQAGSTKASLIQKKPPKGKRMRKIELHQATTQVTKQTGTRQLVFTSQTIENKKQTVNTHKKGKKVKELEKRVEMTENQYKGEIINAKDNYKETITTIHEKPNGETIKKVEVKEGQTQTLEEDDDQSDEENLNIQNAQQKKKQKELNDQMSESSEDDDEEKKKQILERLFKNTYGSGAQKHTLRIEKKDDVEEKEI